MNKGDEACPEYRTRRVAKDTKIDRRDYFFAATPPWEAFKLLLALFTTVGIGLKEDGGQLLAFYDIRRAYVQAVATRDVHVELPEVDVEPGTCSKLVKSLYETRDVAQKWELEYCDCLVCVGF